MPTSVHALATRAKRGEGTRRRRLCKDCKFRPTMDGVVDENPLAEIDQDLLDDTTYDQAVEDEATRGSWMSSLRLPQPTSSGIVSGTSGHSRCRATTTR